MPVDFPDMNSLMWRAKMWKFRQPHDGENEESYRLALHMFVRPKDSIESYEILFGVGWDKWTDEQKRKVLTEGLT